MIKWRYKNTIFLAMSLLALFFVARSGIAASLILKIGDWGYFGAFLVGIFFVSTFTVAPSIIVIYYLAQTLNAWEVALFAGIGAMIGDVLIFNFLRDGFFDEIRPLFSIFKKPSLVKLFNSSHFAWLMPVVGAAIIASPLPDEIGISMMGLSKIKRWQFLIVSFILNATGLFVIALLAG